MALKKKPVTGMKDMLPKEMEIRDYVIQLVKDAYRAYGFQSMETPCVEHIENLCSKQGGDNEKLIFKILKRGEKLKLETAETEDDLVDGGLRYDLTVPLARYYSNHANELPSPFKAMQIGNVWRADRPQKGRFRQFMQCDIDILGDPGCLAEIELIQATTTLLGRLGFSGFQVCVNDRRLLKAMAAFCGFEEKDYDQVFIILDKMDKIGREGVTAELMEAGFEKKKADRYLRLFEELSAAGDKLAFLGARLSDVLSAEVTENLSLIIDSVRASAAADFDLIFDPTLVRGMSYYTGPIFEIKMPELNSAVAGGGRYDEMIGKFTGQATPACGFSIGFERIITILTDRGFQIPGAAKKKAYLIEKGMDKEGLIRIFAEARTEREQGTQVLIVRMNKNKKFQKDQLAKEGYEEFREFWRQKQEEIEEGR